MKKSVSNTAKGVIIFNSHLPGKQAGSKFKMIRQGMNGNNFDLLFQFSFGHLLVLLFFLLQLFHHLAFAITMHGWPGFIFAILCKGRSVGKIVEYHKTVTERLSYKRGE